MPLRNAVVIFAGGLLLGGCSYFVEKPVPGFGDANAHMVQQQTFDPAAPQAPTDPGGGVDGERTAAAVKAYREGRTVPGAGTPVAR